MVALARRVAATDLMPTDPGYGGDENHTQVLFSDWTPANLSPHDENVEVYSNCKEVELCLNGRSLGTETINADASPRSWIVPFAPGTLQAVARNDGTTVAQDELKTAGQPADIILYRSSHDLPWNSENVATIRAKIVDSTGIEIPRAHVLIRFQISGPGAIAAVDNGDNASHEPFHATCRHAYLGECVAYVKTTGLGTIVLTATAPGLTKASIQLDSN